MLKKSIGGKSKIVPKIKSKKELSDDEIELEEEPEIEEDIEDEQEFESDTDESSEEEEEEEDICLADKAIKDDELFFGNNEDEEPKETTKKFVKPEDRVSPSLLTQYEMVRIIGERTKQLMEGAKPLVKNYQGLPYDKIAIEELKNNMVPFKIIRPMPNGTLELWRLEELEKEHLMSLLD